MEVGTTKPDRWEANMYAVMQALAVVAVWLGLTATLSALVIWYSGAYPHIGGTQ